jgi:intracellular multiplication protein IcmG
MTANPATPESATPTATEIAQNNRLDTVTQTVTQDHNAIQNMQNQVNALTTTITNLQGSIASLNSALNNLKTQAMQFQAPVIKPAIIIPKRVITTTYIPVPPIRHYYRPSPGAEYFVKAMIQGRAWLVDSQGATVTVSSGDTLPGYGLIETIDPSQGTVTTSSGAIIQYNPSDR